VTNQSAKPLFQSSCICSSLFWHPATLSTGMLLWRYIGHWYAPLERYLGQAIARARCFAYSSIPRCLHSPRQSSAHGTCHYRVAKNFRKRARRIGESCRVYLRQVESKVHLIAVGPPLVLPFKFGAEGAKVALKRQAAVCCVDDKVLFNRDVAQKMPTCLAQRKPVSRARTALASCLHTTLVHQAGLEGSGSTLSN